MPVGPWGFPDPGLAQPGIELLAVSAFLDADMAVAGYRSGLFAMPLGGADPDMVGWYSPDPRGVLPLAAFPDRRSIRRSRRRFDVTCDEAFDAVVTACADPDRPGAWITDAYRRVYSLLHRRGVAHSVEVWQGGRLVGGVFGVEQGGLFCGESMFSTATDASKVALLALVEQLRAAPDPDRRLFDVQWQTAHLATLGVEAIPRREYLRRLRQALPLPSAW